MVFTIYKAMVDCMHTEAVIHSRGDEVMSFEDKQGPNNAVTRHIRNLWKNTTLNFGIKFLNLCDVQQLFLP